MPPSLRFLASLASIHLFTIVNAAQFESDDRKSHGHLMRSAPTANTLKPSPSIPRDVANGVVTATAEVNTLGQITFGDKPSGASDHHVHDHAFPGHGYALAVDGLLEGNGKGREGEPLIHREAARVTCTWGAIDEDGDPAEVRKGFGAHEYGKCVERSGKAYYVIKDLKTEHFKDGEVMSLVLMEGPTPLPRDLQAPEEGATLQVYEVFSSTSLVELSSHGAAQGRRQLIRTEVQGGDKSLLSHTESAEGDSQVDYHLDVTCTWENINEDADHGQFGTEHTSVHGFDYSECASKDLKVYYVVKDGKSDKFMTGDVLRLTLRTAAVPQMSGRHMTSPWEDQHASVYKVVHSKVVSSAHKGPELFEQGSNYSTSPREASLLIVRVEMNDFVPPFSETTLWRDTWLKPDDTSDLYVSRGFYMGSLSDMFERMSYGRYKLSKSKSKVTSVRIKEDWGRNNGPCPDFGGNMTRQTWQLLRDKGIEPDSFDFREVVIPTEPWNGCGWAGMSTVGCTSFEATGTPRGVGKCMSWLRVAIPYVRAHELGHNMGFAHSLGPDETSLMGHAWKLTDFTPTDREKFGILQVGDKEILEVNSVTGPITLGSVSQPLGHNGAQYAALKISCPQCASRAHPSIKGGHIMIFFRGSQHYSGQPRRGLIKKMQNQVFAYFYTAAQNELLEHMGDSKTFSYPNFGFKVYVCSIGNEVAKVAVANDERTARGKCSGGGGGGGRLTQAAEAVSPSQHHALEVVPEKTASLFKMDADLNHFPVKEAMELLKMDADLNDFSSKEAMEQAGWTFNNFYAGGMSFCPPWWGPDAWGKGLVAPGAYYGAGLNLKPKFSLTFRAPRSGEFVIHYGTAALGIVVVKKNNVQQAWTAYYWDVASFRISTGDEVNLGYDELSTNAHVQPLIVIFHVEIKAQGSGATTANLQDDPAWAHKCPGWADAGFCLGVYKQFMEDYCKKSCAPYLR